MKTREERVRYLLAFILLFLSQVIIRKGNKSELEEEMEKRRITHRQFLKVFICRAELCSAVIYALH